MTAEAEADRNLVAWGWESSGFGLGDLLRAGLGETQTDRHGGRYCQRLRRRTRGGPAAPSGISRKVDSLEPGVRYTFTLWYKMPQGQSFAIIVERRGRTLASGEFRCGDRGWKNAGLVFDADGESAVVHVSLFDRPGELLLDDAGIEPMPEGRDEHWRATAGFERFRIEGFAPLAAIRSNRPIVVDGRPDEPVWRQAPPAVLADDFGRPGSAAPRTSFRAAWHGDLVSVFITCMEPSPQALRRSVTARDGDGERDDCIEVVIETDRQPDHCYQLIVTAGGVLSDLVHRPDHIPGRGDSGREVTATDRGFDAQAQWKVRTEPDRWHVELSIPAQALGAGEPARGRQMGFNVCRLRYAGGRPQRFAWSPTGGDFRRTGRLGLVVFDFAGR